MNRLAVQPATAKQLASYQEVPAHALMLVGPTGSGKYQLAVDLAESVLQIQNFNDSPYTMHIAPIDGKAIGIEAVRKIEQFLSLKVPGTNKFNRAIIIENAHELTIEAQNALLKTLEEPPTGTILILTVAHEQALLPTIRSRAQAIAVNKPDKSVLTDFFAQTYETADIAKAYAISGGLPGLMEAMLSDQEHPLTQATQKARQLLNQTTYERLLSVDELAKSKRLAIDTTFILQQMAHVSLQSAEGPSATKWKTVLTASYEASEALSGNTQPKLVLTNLMLNL